MNILKINKIMNLKLYYYELINNGIKYYRVANYKIWIYIDKKLCNFAIIKNIQVKRYVIRVY